MRKSLDLIGKLFKVSKEARPSRPKSARRLRAERLRNITRRIEGVSAQRRGSARQRPAQGDRVHERHVDSGLCASAPTRPCRSITTAERSLRSIVVGRRNPLRSRSRRGTEVAALSTLGRSAELASAGRRPTSAPRARPRLREGALASAAPDAACRADRRGVDVEAGADERGEVLRLPSGRYATGRSGGKTHGRVPLLRSTGSPLEVPTTCFASSRLRARTQVARARSALPPSARRFSRARMLDSASVITDTSTLAAQSGRTAAATAPFAWRF